MKIKAEIWNGMTQHIYAHLKLDGNFTRITKDSVGSIACYSSLDTDLTNIIKSCKPRWLAMLMKKLPLDSSILGEIYYYDTVNKCGRPASYIKTGLSIGENFFNKDRLKYSRGNITCGTNELCFSGFAIEKLFGEYVPAERSLEDIQSLFVKFGVNFAPFIYCGYNSLCNENFFTQYSRERLLDYYLPIFRSRSDVKGLCDGFVLKDGNLLNWKKCKPINTLDVFVTGFVPGKGKYTGQVGSLLVSIYNNAKVKFEIAKVGGFCDGVRAWVTNEFQNNRVEILEKVMEIEYQGVASKGGLRHPMFKNWREDKLAEECITSQDPDLERFYG